MMNILKFIKQINRDFTIDKPIVVTKKKNVKTLRINEQKIILMKKMHTSIKK